MKITEKLRLVCPWCKHYRVIVYANGSSAMGCLKGSDNGYPVDIKNLDHCPRTHPKRRDIEIDRSELLSVLGKLYAECAPHPAHIALYEYLAKAGPTVKKYKTSIGRAITAMGVMKVVSRGVEGKRGNTCIYRWNLKTFGPPSLELVDKIIMKMCETFEEEKVERLAKSSVKETPKSRTLQIDAGITSCDVCWLKDFPDCREKLMALGLDCKHVNINTIRYGKSSVGQQDEEAEG